MEPGGSASEATDFASLVKGAVASGVETLSIHTFVFTSTVAGENRIAIPIDSKFPGIRVGVKDNVGTTGTAWIQASFNVKGKLNL